MQDQTFILQEVIDELVNVNITLTSPLFKLQYFALLVKNDELLQYVTKEIEGYDKKDEGIPEYRKTIATLKVEARSSYNNETLEIPVAMLEKEFHKAFQYLIISESVGVLEQMKNEFDKDSKPEKYISTPLPLQMLPYIQKALVTLYKGDPNLSARSARLLGNKNVVIEILNTTRSRLLKFCMEMGEKFGFDIKIESFKKRSNENNQIVYNLIRNEISNIGHGNVTNTGNESTLLVDTDLKSKS